MSKQLFNDNLMKAKRLIFLKIFWRYYRGMFTFLKERDMTGDLENESALFALSNEDTDLGAVAKAASKSIQKFFGSLGFRRLAKGFQSREVPFMDEIAENISAESIEFALMEFYLDRGEPEKAKWVVKEKVFPKIPELSHFVDYKKFKKWKKSVSRNWKHREKIGELPL